MKPLGQKSYGSIPHLPGSRLGPGDHHCSPGQARICTGPRVKGERPDRRDRIIAQEKLDGSCCAVAKLRDGQVVALGRAGYLATTSKYEQHHLFAEWVRRNYMLFDELLKPGERFVGEWLAQAHGTRYQLTHEPYVIFDLMVETTRAPWSEVHDRLSSVPLVMPRTLHNSQASPLSIEEAMDLVQMGSAVHGAIDQIEGVVWRVERDDVVDFLAKYVRPDKVDGCYLPEVTGKDPIWNWRL